MELFTLYGNVASSAVGWCSIACWIIVYTPQLLENYTLKSGEGLSVYFVLIWLIGDLSNLVGATLAGLLPTVILLPIYYTICDIGLLFQIYYYRITSPVHLVDLASAPSHSIGSDREIPETSPLLGHGRNRRESSPPPWWHRHGQLLSPYFLGICFVLLFGGVSYIINARSLYNDHPPGHTDFGRVVDWKSQLFGWISTVLYVSSRIPQIVKNFSTKCTGLTPLLFFFAICGNTTFVLSILLVSRDPAYLRLNAPWLTGSCLNVLLDILVLLQFVHYRNQRTVFISDGEQ